MNGGRAPLEVLAVGPGAAATLARLHARAFAAPWDEQAMADLLGSSLVFALQAGDPPVGFVLARVVADEAEILTLAIDPVGRRCGTGGALVAAAAGTALAMGARNLWLEVAEDNAAARALYAGARFEAAGRRPGYYRRKDGTVDALLLHRRLNSAPA